MLLGQAGMLSFGHAGYFGLGGFFTLHAIRAVNDEVWQFPLELMPLVGGVGGLAFGIIFGSISTRRAGVTFAMITLGIGSMVESSANMFTDFFGGESGISGNRVTDVTLFGFSYGPSIEVYYLIGAWTVIAAVAMYFQRGT
jgi:branched-chain amino acid transport system permease protein